MCSNRHTPLDAGRNFSGLYRGPVRERGVTSFATTHLAEPMRPAQDKRTGLKTQLMRTSRPPSERRKAI
jgi:hypothetical protein